MQGDDKAKATVDAMMSGLLKDVSKYSLEKGVASSVLSNRKDLVRQVWVEVCPVVLNGIHSRRFVMVLKRVRYAPKLVLTEICAKREALRVYQEDGAGNRQARLPLIFRVMLSILESAGCFRLKTGHVP